MRLDDIITGIIIGLVKEGDIFKTTNSGKVIYKDGILSWLTVGGYVSSPVAVNSESVDEHYRRVQEVVEVTNISHNAYGKKLTESDAHDILIKYHFKQRHVTGLAEDYKVSVRMIYYIIDGVHWRDVYDSFHEKYTSVRPFNKRY